MTKALVTIALMLAMAAASAFARQTAQEPTQPPKPRPRPVTFAERMKQYLTRTGATIDDSKSATDMIVSNSADAKGGKITVVLVNDRRRNLLGFYIYNFGSVKNAANKEEVYKYLLEANDAITIGSFFVDGEEDIGYKYLVSSAQAMNQAAFDYAYFTMAAIARDRKPEIRKLLGPANGKDEKPADVKKAAGEKPPDKTSQPQYESAIALDPAQKDSGVDIAIVTATMANIRDEASELSAVVLRVNRDSVLALVDTTPVGPWYNIIDVKSGKEGWVHGSVIRIVYTRNRTASPVFNAERVSPSANPSVEISNESDEDINLKVGRNLYTIPTHSKKGITLTPGTYRFYTSAPGVIPSFGEQTFETGYRYTWQFWIRTVVR